MKIHFSATAPFDHIEMCGDAPCGAGKGVSQYGIDCTATARSSTASAASTAFRRRPQMKNYSPRMTLTQRLFLLVRSYFA
jgi:hypothetical protein